MTPRLFLRLFNCMQHAQCACSTHTPCSKLKTRIMRRARSTHAQSDAAQSAAATLQRSHWWGSALAGSVTVAHSCCACLCANACACAGIQEPGLCATIVPLRCGRSNLAPHFSDREQTDVWPAPGRRRDDLNRSCAARTSFNWRCASHHLACASAFAANHS